MGLVVGCSKDDPVGGVAAESKRKPEPGPQPSPATDDDAGDQSVGFFVELLNRSTYPFLGSGRLQFDRDADAGVAAAEFEFEAPPDGRLSIVVARDPADGTFLGLGDGGVPLFEKGVAREGDVSRQLALFELAPGDAGDLVVRQTSERPEAELSVEAVSDTGFRAQLRVPAGFAGGMFTVHRPPSDMFQVGDVPPNGLGEFVTDGDTSYFKTVADGTNFSSHVAPGVYVVHSGGEPLFTRGEPDRGLGLEHLAEDANPFPLVDALKDTLDGVEPFPEAKLAYEADSETKESTSYSFVVWAEPGDRLSLAGMLAQTNDVFVGTPPRGIALFENGEPINGDYTSKLSLWDAGTEVNERPGYGPNQGPRQAKRNSGPSESEPIDHVDDGFDYPPLGDLIQLTISGG